MKNIPIIGKFTSILAVFGLFSLIVVFYAAYEMGAIRDSYNHTINAPAVGATNVTRANRALEDARAKIAQLMFDTNAADRQAMLADISNDKAEFTSVLDQAASVNIVHASDIQALESRGQQLLASDCSNSIGLAESATSAAGLMNAQAEFLKSCAPGFNGLVHDMLSESIGFRNFTHIDEVAASNTVGNTIKM
jgi:methyl-accepting chemotaxis protein